MVDRGLGGFERKAAVGHLLGCADCRTLVAYVLRTQDGVSSAPRGSGGRAAVPRRHRKVGVPPYVAWMLAGALVAFASPFVA